MPSLNEREETCDFSETISAYIQERYQITPDFPFKNTQTISSFRHPRNAKWFCFTNYATGCTTARRYRE